MRGIVYFDSKYGTTKMIAKWIAGEIDCERIMLKKVEKGQQIDKKMDFYILGMPIYNGKPLPNMCGFIMNNRKKLCSNPVFIYITSWAEATSYKAECIRFIELINHYLIPCKPVMLKSLPGNLSMDSICKKDQRIMKRLLRRIDSMAFDFHSDSMKFGNQTNINLCREFGREINEWIQQHKGNMF